MQKQFLSHSIFVNLRRLAILLFCGVACSMLTGTLLGFLSPESASNSSVRTLTFAERVGYQRAIEDVYWRHRIWPKENPDPKPALNTVMSQTQLEKKVEDYLCDSQVLEDNRQRPLTAQQLQAEMDRMAQHTRQPEVLNELFEALGNDPFVIAECLARPVLSERLVADLSAQDKTKLFHSARTKELSRMSMAAASTNAAYILPKVREGDSPCIDGTWAPTSLTNVPSARDAHTAVWTGSEMIVWGGYDGTRLDTGAKYSPSTDSWVATSTANVPTGRSGHTAVWTGGEVIVWGGISGIPYLDSGGRYNPITDTWTATSTAHAPAARTVHTAVWTGNEMIIWGGYNGSVLNSGGRYDPGTDSWTTTSTTGAPAARYLHTAVWTGSEMIAWGGLDTSVFNTGGRYDPTTNSWVATNTNNAPTAREQHRAVWTNSEMIVWGGDDINQYLNTGGRYNPGTDAWTATNTANAPSARNNHTAIWTDSKMIVWGGFGPGGVLNAGAKYDPSVDSWIATSTSNAPTPRVFHTAVWTGSEMIIWGGQGEAGLLNTGGRYCSQSSGPFTLTAAGRKVQGINTVRLTWSGATSTNIDVYRNGTLVVTTANDGLYTDSTGDTGRARYTYRVCEAGTNSCSNNARVTFRQ